MLQASRTWSGIILSILAAGFDWPSGGESLPRLGAVLLPGGVADSAGQMGFVINPVAKIDALNLQSGATVWSTSFKGLPLIAWENRLAVLVGTDRELRMLVLDTAHGGNHARTEDDPSVLIKSAALNVPAWVAERVAKGSWPRFQSFAVGGKLDLTWIASDQPEYGIDPIVLPHATGAHISRGAARIDLSSGHIVPRQPEASSEKVRMPSGLEDVISHPYQRAGRYRADPLVVGDKIVALEMKKSDSKSTLFLKSWDRDSGKEQKTVELAPASAVAPIVSLDDKYLMVAVGGSEASKLPHHRIISLATGRLLAELPIRQTVRAAAVLDNRAYVAVDAPAPQKANGARLLQAYALPDGKLLWEHPLRGAPVSTVPRRLP